VRRARFIATAGAATGAGLLVLDLRTKRRWYNMLRIFRPTSPMSIGTYVLSSFGFFTGLTFLGELFGGRRLMGRAAARAADLAQVPAALAGAGMATYTAALFSSTSTPGWAAVPEPLGVQFATSAVASAAAALSIAEHARGDAAQARALDAVAATATAAHLAASVAADARRKSTGVSEPRAESPAAASRDLADFVIAGVLPLALYGCARLLGSRSRDLSMIAAGAVLAGNYLSRMTTLHSGNRSADHPRDYFRLARRRNLPALHSADRARTTLQPMR
jgi:formate-dependent nitrite reductase membrane component NrfD